MPPRAVVFTGPLVAMAAAFVLAWPASAQPAPGPRIPQISVTGEGEARLAPDMAVMNLSVLREAPTAREALTANNEAMRQVIAALKEAGIAERDIQTSAMSIQPRTVHPTDRNGLKEPKIVGYRATNRLTVRVRDLAKVGELLDRSVSLGVNQGGTLQFTNDDPSAAVTEARRRAMADAMAKARTLTETAGIKLGRVLSINEQSRRPQPVPFARQAMAAPQEAADAVPLAAGENTYSVTVGVSFELDQ